MLHVYGEIDMATAPRLRQQVINLVNVGARQIVLDLCGVDFLDSIGLGVVVGAVKRVRAHDGQLRIVCDQPHLLELFQITRLDAALELHLDIDDAVAATRLRR